ncbi:MarC family protein [Cyanobium sp. CH-040]|uniref:MarC family protein n=1 Tax=Cyanobium sp. CH-040 TaxID=2823708 RepID=UPI0020CCB8A7|nr:MarC family protein [Cyanobium sp. CH-040]MCP9928235.1 MarC family protein [Cyanobium sp. CH-040]
MSLINTAVGLVALTDPIGVLPVVIEAANANPGRVRRIGRLAATTYLVTLLLSCWWGQSLLDLFGISLPAFRIAGGLILLPYGLRLIEGVAPPWPPAPPRATTTTSGCWRWCPSACRCWRARARSRWWWRRRRPNRSAGWCSAP